MPEKERGGRGEGIAIVLLGSFVVGASLKLGGIGLESANQSMGLFPFGLGIILVACGLGVLWSKVEPIRWPTQPEGVRVSLAFFILLAYIPAVEVLGYPAATAVFFGIESWLLGAKGPRRIAFLSIVVSIVAAYAFQNLLEIDLPDGLIPKVLGLGQ